jgi:hypothetical protein
MKKAIKPCQCAFSVQGCIRMQFFLSARHVLSISMEDGKAGKISYLATFNHDIASTTLNFTFNVTGMGQKWCLCVCVCVCVCLGSHPAAIDNADFPNCECIILCCSAALVSLDVVLQFRSLQNN